MNLTWMGGQTELNWLNQDLTACVCELWITLTWIKCFGHSKDILHGNVFLHVTGLLIVWWLVWTGLWVMFVLFYCSNWTWIWNSEWRAILPTYKSISRASLVRTVSPFLTEMARAPACGCVGGLNNADNIQCFQEFAPLRCMGFWLQAWQLYCVMYLPLKLWITQSKCRNVPVIRKVPNCRNIFQSDCLFTFALKCLHATE